MNLRKYLLAALTATIVATGLTAQRRAPRYEGSLRKAVRIEQKDSAERTKRITAAVNPRTIKPAFKLNSAGTSGVTERKVSRKVLGDGTTIYGSIIYPSGYSCGIYSFRADQNPNITSVLPLESYEANGGGTYADGKYYYFSYVYTDEMGYSFLTFLTVDVATGKVERNTRSFLDGFDETQITHDLTYDPTTGTIFAISYIIETDDTGYFQYVRPAVSTVDTYTGFVTPIGGTGVQLIAIAANMAGELYGISKAPNSSLYRINKETGECTEIGRTGLNPEYTQSATFDPVTDKLYWAETEITGTSGLYEVNITTGAAQKICDFARDEEFTGIYIPEPVIAAGAPGVVTDQSASYTNGSLSGSITFTVPATTYGGASLSGALTANVVVDGVARAPQNVSAGQKVSIPLTFTEGIHSYTVQISNAAGTGPRTGYSWYVGIDGPAPVQNLTATEKNGKPYISWTAPTIGRNGGYIDPSKLTYTVVRMPDAVTVAQNIITTNCTDQTSFAISNVYYVVTASCDGRQGVEASTPTALFGTGYGLPVTYTFDTEEEFNLCTVVDANGDAEPQYHWGYWMYSDNFPAGKIDNPALVYGYSPEGAADDWVFIPPFDAVAGQKYRVTFTMWTRGEKEKLEVTAGPSNQVTGQTVILPMKEYNHTAPQEFVAEFTAANSGNCYVGFHCTSDKKRFYLYVDDITVDEVPMDNAPAAVSNLTVTPGANGALTATIAFTAPSKTAAGATLSQLSEINIYRGNSTTSIHTFSAPAAGASLSWTDTAPVQGFNTYRVVASNAAGAGEKALATEYIGYDLAVAPTNVALVDGGDHPVLTWTAPTEGQNGGYINPTELVYYIIRSDNTVVSRNATGTQFVDTDLDPKTQHFVYYQIQAVTKAGYGEPALSDYVVFGYPYEGDFFESFSDALLSTDPWVTEKIKGNNQLWTIQSMGYYPTCYPADYDNGLMAFLSTDGRYGDEGRLISPKLSLDEMNVPVFSFAFFHNPDIDTLQGGDQFQDRLIPELRLPDGSFVALDDAIYVDDPNCDVSWYQYVYDLSAYKKYDYVQLCFHGIAGYENDVYVDMISLEDNSEYDLAGYSFSGPTAVKVGKSATYRATIFNQGMKTAENYSVDLYRNNAVFMSLQGEPLRTGATATFEFPVSYTIEDEAQTYSYFVKIVFDRDEVPSNNTSQSILTYVESPDVPQPRFVEANVQGKNNVALTWGDADGLHVNDSFEDYASFSIKEIGDYTLVDGDKGSTYTFADIYYDNASAPMAFMVFNPVTLGITKILPEYLPKTGDQMLAAFAAWELNDNGYAVSIDNDDWFISPEVHPGSTVSFWCKAILDYISEREKFEVMYSSTDKSTSSFKSLTGVMEADYEWTQYTYTLPADAKYFAIHRVGNDSFILFIDDLQFTGVCGIDDTLKGFRVYRDNTILGDVAVNARSFTDSGVADGLYTYGVSALFGNRESAKVPVPVQIGELSADDAVASAVRITTEGKAIVIENAEGLDVTVSTAAGVNLLNDNSAADYRVNAVSGIYVVRAGDVTAKVIVK